MLYSSSCLFLLFKKNNHKRALFGGDPFFVESHGRSEMTFKACLLSEPCSLIYPGLA